MLSMIENIFIFGVILPALVTIIFFLGFLICWFKCDLREKIMKRCLFKKRQNSSASNSTAHSGRRIHYIKDTLDSHSAGSKDRHPSGGSNSTMGGCTPNNLRDNASGSPPSTSANHSNMGFEIEEDFKYVNNQSGLNAETVVPIHGPSSIIVKDTRNVHNGYNNNSKLSPVNNTRLSNIDNTISLQVLNSHNNNKSVANCSLPDVIMDNGEPRSRKSPQIREHIKPWGTPPHLSVHELSHNSNSPGVHSSHQKYSSSRNNNSKTPQRRSDFVQQVFQFPHGKHHSNKLTTKSNGISLDNSTSSYSSSSNEGDYYDGDYGHFVPTTHYTTNDMFQKPAANNSNHVLGQSKQPKYKSGIQVLREYRPEDYTQQPADTQTSSSEAGIHYSAQRDNINHTSNNRETNFMTYNSNQNHHHSNIHQQQQYHSTSNRGQNLHLSMEVDMRKCGSRTVDISGVHFTPKEGINLVENV